MFADVVGAGDEDEVVNDSSSPSPEVGTGKTPLLSTEGKAFSRPRFFVFVVICDSIFIASTLLLLSFVMLSIGTTVVVLAGGPYARERFQISCRCGRKKDFDPPNKEEEKEKEEGNLKKKRQRDLNNSFQPIRTSKLH